MATFPASYDVLVIGGGASGLAAAISAARAGATVAIAEADVAVGLPILATGNGRCNLSNARLDPARYRHPSIAEEVMGKAPEESLNAFFSSLGLITANEDDRIYPFSKRAETVRDVLLDACERLDIDLLTCHELTKAQWSSSSWELHFSAPRRALKYKHGADFRTQLRQQRRDLKSSERCERAVKAASIILACGGTSDLPRQVFGLQTLPKHPVLCPLAAEAPLAPSALSTLNGLRHHVALSIKRDGVTTWSEAGEVLFRPYGISGIVAFNASRRAQAGDIIAIDFFPHINKEELSELLKAHEEVQGHFNASRPAWFDGILAPSLASAASKLIDALSEPGHEGIPVAASVLKHFKLQVTGTTEESTAQAMRGGIPFDDVDILSLKLKTPSNAALYACGEALDMDADCGGFNLAWAWLSGLRAGASAASVALAQRDL